MTIVWLDGIKDIKIDGSLYYTDIIFKMHDGSTAKLELDTKDAAYLAEKMREKFPVGKEAN